MSIRKRLASNFISALGLSDEAAAFGARYRHTSGWDSVAHMALVAAIEADFDIMMDTDQILDLSSFDKGIEILAAHGHAD